MKTFSEFLNEEETITVKKATSADRKKGEVYVVHDGKNIVKYNKKWMDGIKRDSAENVAKTNDSWKVASSSFAADKDIKIPG